MLVIAPLRLEDGQFFLDGGSCDVCATVVIQKFDEAFAKMRNTTGSNISNSFRYLPTSAITIPLTTVPWNMERQLINIKQLCSLVSDASSFATFDRRTVRKKTKSEGSKKRRRKM